MKHSSHKLLITFSLYFVLVLGAYVFLYMHILTRSEAIAATRTEIAALERENTQIHELNRAIQNTEEERKRISNFFVDGDHIVEFLETIESMGRTAGVDVEVRAITEKKTGTDVIKELDLTIEFGGNWPNMHHFLVLLESIPIKMTVEKLTFRLLSNKSVQDEGVVPAEWTGSVNVRTLQLSN